MGNSNILIDTSIIIDYLRKQNKKSTEFWRLINQYECAISTVTLYELYSGVRNDKQKDEVALITSFLTILSFDATQAKEASKIFKTLKQENKLIEFRDIFIASCAICKNIPLATLNKKHFERIENIELL